MNDVHVEGEEEPIDSREVPSGHDGRCALWFGRPCDCKAMAPQWDTARTGGLRLPHEDAAGDTGLYFAVLEKTGSLCTRGGRPIVATRAQWQELQPSLPAVVHLPAAPGFFGVLPMYSNGEPDMIARLISALSMLESGAKMVAQRVEQLDKRLNDQPETLGQKLSPKRIQL